ncbi:MAG TPA: hypothetical protein VNU45_00310 [Rummeliibacillus sp.]|nr:hypothetical protein [Rummeliibacillus sp.]
MNNLTSIEDLNKKTILIGQCLGALFMKIENQPVEENIYKYAMKIIGALMIDNRDEIDALYKPHGIAIDLYKSEKKGNSNE